MNLGDSFQLEFDANKKQELLRETLGKKDFRSDIMHMLAFEGKPCLHYSAMELYWSVVHPESISVKSSQCDPILTTELEVILLEWLTFIEKRQRVPYQVRMIMINLRIC